MALKLLPQDIRPLPQVPAGFSGCPRKLRQPLLPGPGRPPGKPASGRVLHKAAAGAAIGRSRVLRAAHSGLFSQVFC